ncbi:MAG: glutamate 5-kinase [Pseudomonadota bacterium]|nr:glutamate 5-kinase [Pseudomonadota bacterium]
MDRSGEKAGPARWVVKIGSALITRNGRGLATDAIARWAHQIARLREQHTEIVLVSSGAVAEGMARLGWGTRPHALNELQAAAAVGQAGLVQAYESHFQTHGAHSAQVLLTHEDLKDRSRYLNARSTLCKLLSLRVIPVVNENDTVAIDEIRFGDNDTLAALVANLVGAQLLVILTDRDGVFDSDPALNANARLIESVRVDNPLLDEVAGPSAGTLGLGGMVTKVSAARRAARSGTTTIIAPGYRAGVLEAIHGGETVGTRLLPAEEPLAARKQWLANQLRASGVLHLDDGAVRVLQASGRSLLAIGVTGARGDFQRGEMVICKDRHGREVARGLINYGAQETLTIMGKPSGHIEALLGYVDEPELIHRDNMVVMDVERGGR